jgi:hypothetical protein
MSVDSSGSPACCNPAKMTAKRCSGSSSHGAATSSFPSSLAHEEPLYEVGGVDLGGRGAEGASTLSCALCTGELESSSYTTPPPLSSNTTCSSGQGCSRRQAMAVTARVLSIAPNCRENSYSTVVSLYEKRQDLARTTKRTAAPRHHRSARKHDPCRYQYRYAFSCGRLHSIARCCWLRSETMSQT